MKASLVLVSLLTAFTSHSLKSPAVPPTVVPIRANTNLAIADGAGQIGSTLPIRRMCSLPILAVMSARTRGMFRCGDPCIAQPEGQFAETGARRYGEEFCRLSAKVEVKAPGQQHRSPSGT